MKQGVLVFCDPEEDYAQRMCDYMRKDKLFPWSVKVYTHTSQLLESVKERQADMLVVSERIYQEELQKLCAGKTVILNETGTVRWEKVNNVDKYQEAGKVLQQLMELGDVPSPGLGRETGAKLIGLYSPVRRCLQTSFGLCYGKLLARKGKTLYLSFEQYCGMEELRGNSGMDITSLLYYLGEEGQFVTKAKGAIRQSGDMDYVEAVVNGQNLLYISCGEWKALLRKLTTLLGYEYIILDLSESVQGLFEILRMCERVYTLAKDDPIAKRKIDQYEQLLSAVEYQDVREKMSIYRLPLFRNIPLSMEQATKGDLADYVRQLVEKEEWL